MKLKHIRNYMYYNILDLEYLQPIINNAINDYMDDSEITYQNLRQEGRTTITNIGLEPNNSITFYDFETINLYLKDLFDYYTTGGCPVSCYESNCTEHDDNCECSECPAKAKCNPDADDWGIINCNTDNETKLNNFKKLLIDPSLLRIKELPGIENTNVSDYINNLNTKQNDIFSGYIGISFNDSLRINNFENFILNYTNYEKGIDTNNTNEILKDAFRKSMIMLSQHSLIEKDKDKTPMDTFAVLPESDNWKNYNNI